MPDSTKQNQNERRGFLKSAALLLSAGIFGGGFSKLFANKNKLNRNAVAPTVVPEPYIGSIGMFAGNFAPRGWALCNGQLLAISQYQALFSILGTTYGGDGRTTFALPDLRGRVPIGTGHGPGLSDRRLGSKSGVENVTLSTANIPSHNHSVNVSSAAGNTDTPVNGFAAANSEGIGQYASSANDVMASTAIGNTGGSQAHTNMQPYLAINYVIALQGLFPSRS